MVDIIKKMVHNKIMDINERQEYIDKLKKERDGHRSVNKISDRSRSKP
jgi:hypothetical protein